MRLAPEETSVELTGYGDHGVTCIGMKTDIPVKINLWIKIGILILIIYMYNNISHLDNYNEIIPQSPCFKT
jgi:hypothetical protein